MHTDFIDNDCVLLCNNEVAIKFEIQKFLRFCHRQQNYWSIAQKYVYQDNPYSHVWFNKIKLILHGTLNKEFKLKQKRSEIEVNFVIEINYYQKYP